MARPARFLGRAVQGRAAKPDAVFVFYPGAAGVQFLNQYAQAGLQGQIPLYTAFTIDLRRCRGRGSSRWACPGAQQWVNDLPNDANKKFVADFKAKHKAEPSFYGAQSYDAASLSTRAVGAAKGDLTKRSDARRDAKGRLQVGARHFKYGNNHFPIQNFYLQEVVKDGDGTFASRRWRPSSRTPGRSRHECTMK